MFAMKRKIIVLSLFIASALCLSAQKKTEGRYELIKNMPVYYETLRSELTFPDAWGNSRIKSFPKWRREARKILTECLQRAPRPADDFDYKVVATEQRDGYRAEKIEFNISAYTRIPAYLLVPDGEGPFPALVVLHDHGAHFSIGKEKNVRPFGVDDAVMQDARRWAENCYEGVFVGDFFAAHGYVVLAIDAFFWGERGRQDGVKYEAQEAVSANFLQMGMSWCGYITYDDVASVDFLATLPFVDAESIGAVGFSMGAHRAWMLSAMTDKVYATAAICWLNTSEYLLSVNNNQSKGQSAYSMIVPELRNHLDYPHVASIICPKPFLMFNGAYDKLFPVQGTRDAFDILEKTWQSQHVADRLQTKIWDTPHTFNRAMQTEVLQFLDKHLKH